MKLLLDTHVWLWSLLAPERLSARVRSELTRAGNELWLSPVSVWEASLLAERRRVVLRPDFAAWLSRALANSPLREAPITHEIALETAKLGMQHRDPADRFLAATARVLDLVLATADDRLIRSGVASVLAND